MNHTKCILIILFTFISFASNAEDHTFALVDKSCVLSGPDEKIKSIKTAEGSKGASICKQKSKRTYSCSYAANEKEAKVNEILLEFLNIDPSIILLSNEVGNIKIIVDTKKKSFTWGQVTALADKGIILNKYCVGYVLDRNDMAKVLKDGK